jgi:hypothetical protein
MEPESLETGYRQMYNLDFSGAHKTFEAWEGIHPSDPVGPASNAAVYLFSEFQRLHVLDLELFTEAKRMDNMTPDPAIRFAFESELTKAESIAEKNLAKTSSDCNSLFARSLVDGLRGNYAALIEKRKGAALEFLKSSRSNAEQLIAIDPTYYDAYLAVGLENYVLGLHAAPTRLFLRFAGAQTDKKKGIESLKITAKSGHYLGPYARLLLAIAALRDHDQTAAKKLLASLASDFPQNPLYKIELDRLQKGNG